MISYPWASNSSIGWLVKSLQRKGARLLVEVVRSAYRGNAPKRTSRAGRRVCPAAARFQRAEGQSSRGGESVPSLENSVGPGGLPSSPPADLNLEGLDALWTLAEQQLSGWQSISLAATFRSKCTTGIHDRPRQRWSATETGSNPP